LYAVYVDLPNQFNAAVECIVTKHSWHLSLIKYTIILGRIINTNDTYDW